MSPVERRVSIVIRTRDVERHLSELMLRLSSQTLRPSELIVVDNYSSNHALNGMVETLQTSKRKFFKNRICIKLVPIADSEFSHAYSTNAGVSQADCEAVCITNAHSLPTSDSWLESGIANLDNSEIAGVGGYSRPHADGTVWEKLAYEWGWKRANELSRAYAGDDFFSTINCVLRKALWEEYHFDEELPKEIPQARFGGEDYDWAKEMIARGNRIIVEPKLAVFHSHGETLPQLLSKYLIWLRIKSRIKSLERPRTSTSKLGNASPRVYQI